MLIGVCLLVVFLSQLKLKLKWQNKKKNIKVKKY